ncbi:unnamed protein product [Macrosiphum euphorbiae]|uniref:DDE-1 domain-containing protein n=1 Tax=Macrosiphum euphorbiae TaxID=13131 RepID=A0AAV0Y615_9HEMI|nr:unnamed protein product [Macrosiphum euphorbiae]
MEEPLFFNWFTTVFVKHVEQKRIDLKTNATALLLYDGHCSHISVRIIATAIKHNITLFKFPSHLTDKLQPLDKFVFSPLKTLWEKKKFNLVDQPWVKVLEELQNPNLLKCLAVYGLKE